MVWRRQTGSLVAGSPREDNRSALHVKHWEFTSQRPGIPLTCCLNTVGLMRAIIIGAGRGRRLMPTTADTPKCYAEVQGRRLLDWALHAFAGADVTDLAFI